MSERRKIISGLEKYKVAVRSIPSLHEIVADQKKNDRNARFINR